MQRLRSDQKNKVKNFVAFTHQPEQLALAYLQHADWNVDMAVDLYYQNPNMFQAPTDTYKLERIFATYANDARDDVGPQRIGPNGMLRLLTDLQLEATDRRVLILACKMNAQTQCEFSWEEWQHGFSVMKVDSIEGLRVKLRELDNEMTDHAKFRELYQFAFSYGKPISQRSLDMETALAYWRILFHDKFPLLDMWEKFVINEHGKGISRDTWNLLLDFCFNIKPDLSNFDDDGAWPVLIDEFVEHVREKMNLPRPNGST